MWIWNPHPPAPVPAGARISAGKSGNVDRSLPKRAELVVNRSPASCMPSPEAPAKRMTTRSNVFVLCADVTVSANAGPPGKLLCDLAVYLVGGADEGLRARGRGNGAGTGHSRTAT